MLFSGLKNLTLSLFFIFLASCSSSQDFRIAMPDQLKNQESPIDQMEIEEDSDDADFVMGNRSGDLDVGEVEEKPEEGFALQDKAKAVEHKLSKREKILSTGNEVPFTHEKRDSLIEFRNEDIYKRIYNTGESAFSFSYITDNYDVSDANNVFQESFVEAPGSKRGGTLHLNFDDYISRGFLNTFYGLGIGVGYSVGKGFFQNSANQESNVKFQLYSIPIDLKIGFELVPSRFFKLSFAGGPSALGLMQTRNDLDREDDRRYRRQVSYGYFAHGKLQISINSFSTSSAIKTFGQSDVTNMYINAEARLQSYENFQDDISITGASFGLGFSFEYF